MPTFQPLNVRYDGARMQAVRGKRAALLLYTMQGGHRVTMYVFDAQTVPLQRTHLQPRVVRQQPVYVGERPRLLVRRDRAQRRGLRPRDRPR